MSEAKCGNGQCSESSGKTEKWSAFDYREAARFPWLVALMRRQDAGESLTDVQVDHLDGFRLRQEIVSELSKFAERRDQVAPAKPEWVVKFKLIAKATIHKTVAKDCLVSVFTDKECPVKAVDHGVVGYRVGKVKHFTDEKTEFTSVNLFIKVVAASAIVAVEKASDYTFGRLDATREDHPYSHGRVAKVLDY